MRLPCLSVRRLIPILLLANFDLWCFGETSRALYGTRGRVQDTCQLDSSVHFTDFSSQWCLPDEWASRLTSEGSPQGQATAPETIYVTAATQDSDTGVLEGITPEDSNSPRHGDVGSRSFMSFEDWKELMLRRSGQDPNDLRSRKRAADHTDGEGSTYEAEGLDSVGDDGELSLNFDTYQDHTGETAGGLHSGARSPSVQEPQQGAVLYDDGKTQYYRSKDAGKTCKERFSYSSFDAGASVLKTNPGVKNSKAILLENKDSYMLLECAADNKFVIVELTDDILIDTVVIANFEFFSSMIRHFRVSVSDRYPVKIDKWKELGVFEAKNSRDIQPFLVENPLIWAKYVRIEILTHYGNEYYCPLSLLRVHGTRMLESWKETESAPDEDELDNPTIDERISVQESSNVVKEGWPGNELYASTTGETRFHATNLSSDSTILPDAFAIFDPAIFMCKVPQLEGHHSMMGGSVARQQVVGSEIYERSASSSHHPRQGGSSKVTVALAESASSSTVRSSNFNEMSSRMAPVSASEITAQASLHLTATSFSGEEVHTPNAVSANRAIPSSSRNKTASTTSAAPASPTIQESFFKAVTKRLQLLESNVTLSLKYMEDQSRFLQEAQQATDKKQFSRVDAFLDNLNHTVLSELRSVRQQYDQIWQSTITALESQREQSRRETLALSSRLNILAEEVVFQKRMAIVQAILLLSCLVLVIFSRSVVPPLASQFEPLVSSTTSHTHTWLPVERTRHDNLNYESLRMMSPSAEGSQYEQEACHTATVVPASTDDYVPITPSSISSQEKCPEGHLLAAALFHTSSPDLAGDPAFYDVPQSGTMVGRFQSNDPVLPEDHILSGPSESTSNQLSFAPSDNASLQPASLDNIGIKARVSYRRHSSQSVNPRKPLPALPE